MNNYKQEDLIALMDLKHKVNLLTGQFSEEYCVINPNLQTALCIIADVLRECLEQTEKELSKLDEAKDKPA